MSLSLPQQFQVLVDLPEGTPLEQTERVLQALADAVQTVPEVTDYQIYVGTSAPFNFNGLVRYYFMRTGNNVADIQINLVNKHLRSEASHDFAKKVRTLLLPIARKHGIDL